MMCVGGVWQTVARSPTAAPTLENSLTVQLRSSSVAATWQLEEQRGQHHSTLALHHSTLQDLEAVRARGADASREIDRLHADGAALQVGLVKKSIETFLC